MDVHGSRFLGVVLGSQLRLSLACAAVLVAGLAVVPIADNLAPDAVAVRIAGLPVSWWLPALLALPVPIGVSWVYLRRAHDFEDEALGLGDVATLPGQTASSDTDDPDRVE
jgi:hypothetical protein